LPNQPTEATAKKPWYQKGLRFECTQCGDCCTGAPGYVWVNKAEIKQLAKEMGVGEIVEFERQYVHKVGARKSLKEFENGDCVFFDAQQRTCNVYNARPRQCRTWPFWSSNLRSERAWKATCEVCPGSGQGKLYDLQSIQEMRDVMRI
jgi:Fe-S-cluster containining protein